jgi:hypothetical protein
MMRTTSPIGALQVTASIIDFALRGAPVRPSVDAQHASPLERATAHRATGPAPDFRYTRQAPDGALSGAPKWSVLVRIHGRPETRDEVVEVSAQDEETAVFRAMSYIHRMHNCAGRRYLPALEAVQVERTKTHH